MNNNMMNLMQMFQKGNINQQQMLGMFGGNPMFQQAQKMIGGGGNPAQIIKNVAKEKGISQEQLQQLAQNFGIKL